MPVRVLWRVLANHFRLDRRVRPVSRCVLYSCQLLSEKFCGGQRNRSFEGEVRGNSSPLFVSRNARQNRPPRARPPYRRQHLRRQSARPRSRRGYDFEAFLCNSARRACSRAASSGGRTSAGKSPASYTCRISTSAPPSNGARLSHSTASSMDFTCHSQKPAMSSLVSVKGPSVTVRFCPENLTRLPFELGCSPSPASITPAFTSSSLNFPMAAKVSLFSFVGKTPASEFLSAFTITMNRIVKSPCGSVYGSERTPGPSRPAESRLHLHVERGAAESTSSQSFFVLVHVSAMFAHGCLAPVSRVTPLNLAGSFFERGVTHAGQ